MKNKKTLILILVLISIFIILKSFYNNNKTITQSNTKIYINDTYIPSFDYKDSTFVKADTLNNYGFDVIYNKNLNTITITRNYKKQIKEDGNSFNPNQTVTNSNIKVSSIYYDETKTLTSISTSDTIYVKFLDLSNFGTLEYNAEKDTANLKLFTGKKISIKL